MNTIERGDGENIALNVRSVHWKRVFDSFDTKGTGMIPVRYLVEELKKDNRNVPVNSIKRMVKQVDKNRDKMISFPEFLRFLESEEVKGRNSIFSRYIHHTIPRRERLLPVSRRDFTDGQYEEEYSCMPPPVGMIIVSIIEITLFLYDNIDRCCERVDGPLATLFIYNPRRRKEAWRFASYMFVHVGSFHLAVNLAVQILLGIPLEMVHGWWRVLIVYVAGVVAGSLGTSVSDPYVYLAGASGGVYAIIAAHVATIIMNWSEMQYAGYQLMVFLILAASDIGSAVYARYISKENVAIGYVAHLTGAVAGLLVGIYILRNLEVRSWERTVLYIAVGVFIVLMGLGIGTNILFPDYFPRQDV